MSKTLKQKVCHIISNKDGHLNLKVPLKLRWSYINKLRHHNLDRDLERAELTTKRDRANLREMRRQIKDIQKEEYENI